MVQTARERLAGAVRAGCDGIVLTLDEAAALLDALETAERARDGWEGVAHDAEAREDFAVGIIRQQNASVDAARAEVKRYRAALERAHRALDDAAYRLAWDADYLGERSTTADAMRAATQARDEIEAVLELVTRQEDQ